MFFAFDVVQDELKRKAEKWLSAFFFLYGAGDEIQLDQEIF